MPDTTVKYFDSTMSGAPALSGTAGALIGVLDACLVDGFGSVTVDTLAVASNVATATVSAGHQFAMVGNTGPVIRIAGASPAGLNGDWRVTVTSSTAFTFVTSGISDQTASGTITAKRAPAGFSKAFSGTNKAAYRADAVASNRHYLSVNETATANWAQLIGYEAMSDVSTGTRRIPNDTALLYFYKSSTTNSTAREWVLVADDRFFWLFANSQASTDWRGSMLFGDGVSWGAADAFFTLLAGNGTESAGSNYIGHFTITSTGNTLNCWIARSYTQTGGPVSFWQRSITVEVPYPNPVSNDFLGAPVLATEGSTAVRGLLPGVAKPLHPYAGAEQGTLVDNIGAGRTYRLHRGTGNINWSLAVDLTGPWR